MQYVWIWHQRAMHALAEVCFVASLQKLRLHTSLHDPVDDASFEKLYEGPLYASYQRFKWKVLSNIVSFGTFLLL